MSFLDFLKQYEEKKFSKNELEEAIRILSDISYVFQSSEVLRALGGRNEIMKSRIFSYTCICGFYYEEEYHYGTFSDLVDSDISAHYRLDKIIMSNEPRKNMVIKELANNWSDVLQVIYNLQLERNETGDILKAIESDIHYVTDIFERFSDQKCRKPQNPFNVMREDKYTRMIKTATFNPFNITCEPHLQNTQQLPNLRNVFVKELNDLCTKVNIQDINVQKYIISGYVFNLVESYYKNAGYVPMNSLNQILEQVYESILQTGVRNAFSTLDDFKYNCYHDYLNP